jgi:hypothetical protein
LNFRRLAPHDFDKRFQPLSAGRFRTNYYRDGMCVKRDSVSGMLKPFADLAELATGADALGGVAHAPAILVEVEALRKVER